MTIAYFNSASNPADNTAQDGSVVRDVTPPANMVRGQLVRMMAFVRSNAIVPTLSETGGQSWTTTTGKAAGSQSIKTFWCRFNGLWSANPSIDFSAASQGCSVVMHVMSPTTAGNNWAVDVAESEADFSAPTTPFDITVTGITTIATSAVAFIDMLAADDNTYTTLTGTGWAYLGGNQYRNPTGTGIAISSAYKVQAAGATGDITNRQATNGGDAGFAFKSAYKELTAPTLSSTSVTSTSTTGYTVTTTPSEAGTLYLLVSEADAGQPSIYNVINAVGGVASANKAVTTTDTISVTGLDHPIYRLDLVLVSANGDSALVSLTDQLKSPLAGKQYRTFASVDPDVIPYSLITSPAVAAGDIEEVDLVVLPANVDLDPLTDGNYGYVSDGSRQSYRYRIYDRSAAGWMAIEGGGSTSIHWINNQSPYLLDPESELVYTVTVGGTIPPIDLATVAGDAEADVLTVTAVTTEPTGLVAGTFPVTYEWVDVPGDSFEANITYLIGDITVPNCVDIQGADAFALLLDAQLSGVLIYELNGTVEPGIVLRQIPAAGETAPPFSEVALFVAQGLGFDGPLVDLIAFSGPRQATNRSAMSIDVVLQNRLQRVPAVPGSFYWRMDEITTKREIQGWTSITPDTQVTLNITAEQNTIQSRSRSFERRQIIIATDFGLPTQYLQTMVYDLRAS